MQTVPVTLNHVFSLSAVSVAAYLVLSYLRSVLNLRSRQRGRPFPPGPRPLPVVGNLLDVPGTKLGYRDLCAKYGGIVYLNVLGNPVVVVGSASVAKELLEKRSANTSDRPPSTVMPLIGNEISLSVMPYGQWWRDHRRAFWQIFHPEAIRGYREAERVLLLDFLRDLIASPGDLKEHTRYLFAATMMKILYNLDAAEEGGGITERIHEALRCTTSILINRHVADVIPALRFLPGWVPGAGFQYVFAKCKAAVEFAKERPFAKMKAILDAGQTAPCALATLLQRIDGKAEPAQRAYEEDVIKNVGLVAFEGGADSSSTALQAVFLAMSLYPEVLKKAQAELNVIVGPARLPDFGDRDGLVYIDAIIREAMRWHVVVPLAIPHRTVDDDVLDGHFIPAGTDIFVNTWAMLHDPTVYDSPEEFRPERFIRDGKLDFTTPDPYHFAFGYGRRQVSSALLLVLTTEHPRHRICPGRHFVDESLYMTVASALHVFDIGPPLDEDGKPLKIAYESTEGLLSHPKDCRCTIKPRSEQALSLITGA